MKPLHTLIALIILIAIIGMAGNHDWAEEVLCEVPTELYQVIKQDMGGNQSDYKVARYYLDNKQYYDNIASSLGW